LRAGALQAWDLGSDAEGTSNREHAMQTVVRHAAQSAGDAAQPRSRRAWRDRPAALARSSVGALLSLGLAACGGGDKPAPTAPATSVTAVIGPTGGTLTGPDGVQVIVPPGALREATTIGIARSASGAPAALDAYPVPGFVFELTPHDLAFDVPVTVRAPAGSAGEPRLFMASPGQPWVPTAATITNGVAEWQRSSFSWGYVGPCTVPTSMSGDPHWCSFAGSSEFIKATPIEAMTQTAFPRDPMNGSFGAYRVDQAASLQFRQFVRVPGNCGNVTVRFLRRRWAPPLYWSHPAVLAATQELPVQQPVMTADGASYLAGNAIGTVPFSHVDGGHNQFVMVASFDCPGILRSTTGGGGYAYSWDAAHPRHTTMWGDEIMVDGNVPVPSVLYKVAGTTSGLAGFGLVLQNNGGDSLPVDNNGTFTFATRVVPGSPYGVTVLTQPTTPAQTCTVQNGSGTVGADVTNVAVSCVTNPIPKTWRGAGLLETIDEGEAFEHQVAFDGAGNAMAVWSQLDAATGQYKTWARRYLPATGWGTAQRIQSDAAREGRGPRVAFKANGDAMVAWMQSDPGATNVWITSFTAATGSWGTATQVNTGTAGASFPVLAIDPGDNAIVVWPEGSSLASFQIKARRLAAAGWGAVQSIDSAAGGASRPEIAMDAGGNATVVWVQQNATGTGADVWANRFVAGTGWGTATVIETNDRDASNPAIASDAAGNAMAVWVQADDTNPVTNTSSVYSNRFSAGSWGTATLVKGGAPFAWDGAIAMNASGDAVVVWQEDDGFDGASVWARSYAAGVGGTPRRIDDQVTILAVSPRIGVDAGGNAVSVWSQGGHLWSNQATPGTGWGIAADIDPGTSGASRPQLAVDATGNAIAVWQRQGTGVTPGPDLWTSLFK
jgi:hypothetical protein